MRTRKQNQFPIACIIVLGLGFPWHTMLRNCCCHEDAAAQSCCCTAVTLDGKAHAAPSCCVPKGDANCGVHDTAGVCNLEDCNDCNCNCFLENHVPAIVSHDGMEIPDVSVSLAPSDRYDLAATTVVSSYFTEHQAFVRGHNQRQASLCVWRK
ncbi:MAG: hypothetical protein R3C05_27290 [Pirellulaceae bacterium]